MSGPGPNHGKICPWARRLGEGDVIEVLSKHESRWTGRVQDSQQGLSPSHVSQACSLENGVRRHSSNQAGTVVILGEGTGPGRGRLQVPWGNDREEGAFLALRREARTQLSQHAPEKRRKSHCQEATNGASEAD
ncbi:hypothetical protein R3I93_021959 [Phoxinus phoxinus]